MISTSLLNLKNTNKGNPEKNYEKQQLTRLQHLTKLQQQPVMAIADTITTATVWSWATEPAIREPVTREPATREPATWVEIPKIHMDGHEQYGEQQQLQSISHKQRE